MRQQVNLYLDGFEIQKTRLSTNQIGLLALVALVLSALVSGGILIRGEKLEAAKQALTAQKGQKETELEALALRLEEHRADSTLEREEAKLQRSVRAKQQLIALLGEKSSGVEQGFSAYLRGLSKHPIPGVWLTRIQLSNGGRDLGFSGITTRPENLPSFLQAIGREETFAGRQFETLSINADAGDEGEGRLIFNVRTRLGGGAK